MISFLFEQYGYYPRTFVDNCFFIDGWQFKLLETVYDEQDVGVIEQYNQTVRMIFNDKGVHILKNKSGKFISCYGGKKYVLLAFCDFNLVSNDFVKFHLFFSSRKFEIDLNDLKNAWLIQMYEIETIGIAALGMDSAHYCDNLEKILFSIGMCQNAIQYLNDIIRDYGGIMKNAAISHKRVGGMNAFEFFNPFNFVVDNPVRDYAELYRNECIYVEELIEIFSYFNFNVVDASLFFARLLYPANVFDVVEEAVDNKSLDIKINYDVNRELLKIKKVYSFLRQKYNIHPIMWLDDVNFV